MAGTVAAHTKDFARRFFEIVLQRGDENWVGASEAFERTLAAHIDHPYAAYIRANRARKAGFAATAERIRQEEFPQIERRKAGTRRNAPVFYRIGRPTPTFSLELPYEIPLNHPLRVARGAPTGNPMRREPEPKVRSPLRQRLRRRTISHDSRDEAPSGWWHRFLATLARAVGKTPAPGPARSAAGRRSR